MAPSSSDWSRALQSFSLKSRLALYGLLTVGIICLIAFLWLLNSQYLVERPAEGGSLVEGVIGAPSFINPLIATSDTDRDLTTLIYSGLTRIDQTGKIIPDLAKDFKLSDDGLVYTFILRDNLTWQDGEPITTDDIVYTIEQAKNQSIRSPKRVAWEGVTVEKVDAKTIRFSLKQPYSGFLENTTLGILPAHLWKKVPAENFSFSPLNINPIGSGPYQIKNISQDDTSKVATYYDLTPFDNFALGKAKISKLRLRFYDSDGAEMAAFYRGEITSINSIAPANAKNLAGKSSTIITAPLPRVFGVFFNPNENKVFAYKEVRQALDQAVDKQALVKNILSGYGSPLDGPIPPGSAGYTESKDLGTGDIAAAQNLLASKGWKKNANGIYQKQTDKKETIQLSFTINTSNTKELQDAADQIAKTWKKLGAEVTIKLFEKSDLTHDIIRPRKYEAVLFGEVVGRNPDPYIFWHSSQRFDPGLNISLYANVSADKLLEKLRTTVDETDRNNLYSQINDTITADRPAIFLYAPSFIYLVPKDLKNTDMPAITTPSDRFSTIYNWYIETEKVWPIFNH